MASLDVEVASSEVALLGESPRWDPRTEQLVWLDIREQKAFSIKPTTDLSATIDLRYSLTALGLRSGGGWVGVDKAGFVLLDDLSAPAVSIHVVEPDIDVARMNDGNVDARGCFWAGSASTNKGERAGSLYRLHPDGQVERVLTGIGKSNGVGWSPDGGELYYVDTGDASLDVLNVTPQGQVLSRRRLVTIPPEFGLPDGVAVDADGGIWLAIWGAGVVHRYTPAGDLDKVIRLPASRTTACVFGEADLGTLFITTAVRGSARDRAPTDPLGGRLFACRPGATGLVPNMFG
jgi:sugar lactone lactonase YvrE